MKCICKKEYNLLNNSFFKIHNKYEYFDNPDDMNNVTLKYNMKFYSKICIYYTNTKAIFLDIDEFKEYFISEKEYRKLKLKKLNESR
jgi:hypothetical protein